MIKNKCTCTEKLGLGVFFFLIVVILCLTHEVVPSLFSNNACFQSCSNTYEVIRFFVREILIVTKYSNNLMKF